MLRERDQLVPILEALGKRHAEYGAKVEDYAVIGETPIYCIEITLDSNFSSEAKSAWPEVYQWVSDVMIGATSR